MIEQLIKYGRTRRGWLGVRIQTVTDEIAESLDLGEARGALVASVTPTGPAEEAGIQAGDIILTFDGKDIEDMKALPRIVAETDIGKKAKIVVWRDGKEEKFDVELGELEAAEDEGLLKTNRMSGAESKGVTVDSVGLVLSHLTDEIRDEFSISANVNGVVIMRVFDGSEAARKGLIAGDVIVEVNQTAVAKPGDISKTVDDAKEKGRNSILLLINRNSDTSFVALKLAE